MFTKANGPTVLEVGKKMAKKRNPVYLVRPAGGDFSVEEDGSFLVDTNEGIIKGKPGDFLAYDPISGHVWPVSASYVEQHYEPF